MISTAADVVLPRRIPVERPSVTITLKAIAAIVSRKAKTVGAKGQQLPTYGRSDDFARPHIEVSGSEYHYVIVERAREEERARYTNLDDLLFRVFRDITFDLASTFELKHRRPGEDSRRQLFAKQLDFLDRLDPEWRMRAEREIAQILNKYPYDDSAGTPAAGS